MNLAPATALAATLAVLTISAKAGTFNVDAWTGDGDSGISGATNYTAVADFFGDGTRTINTVPFTNTGTTGTGASSYQLLGTPDVFGGFGNSLSGASNLVAQDFFYSGGTAGNANLTIGNLVVGQNYVTTWYNASFGGPGGRAVNITPGDTGTTFTYDQNQGAGGSGHRLTYSFTATAHQITFGFDAVSNADSFHHYAMTNAGPSGTTGGVVTSAASYASAAGNFPFTVLTGDLLETSVGSAVGSGGNFSLEGTGGIGILTNGAFSITGIGGNNPQLATGQSGSSVLYTMDLSSAPLGFDVDQIIGYGGWNDGGRDRQLYDIYYSVVGDSGFTLLGTANNDTTAGSPSAIRSTFNTDLTGVDAVRFNFLAGQENGHAGYGEFDMVGAATIPEPTGPAFAVLGGFALLARRRRQ